MDDPGFVKVRDRLKYDGPDQNGMTHPHVRCCAQCIDWHPTEDMDGDRHVGICSHFLAIAQHGRKAWHDGRACQFRNTAQWYLEMTTEWVREVGGDGLYTLACRGGCAKCNWWQENKEV
ncbi:MAG TPA: hypothetical protein VMW24_24900 [Sedimentisphaerales bacterium]|nr:hypothetical protein [Sedimentisphaerales bacterium]